jgi:hypothetical protein
MMNWSLSIVTKSAELWDDSRASVRRDVELLAFRGAFRAGDGGGIGSTEREDRDESRIDCLIGDSSGASLARSEGATCSLSCCCQIIYIVVTSSRLTSSLSKSLSTLSPASLAT